MNNNERAKHRNNDDNEGPGILQDGAARRWRLGGSISSVGAVLVGSVTALRCPGQR